MGLKMNSRVMMKRYAVDLGNEFPTKRTFRNLESRVYSDSVGVNRRHIVFAYYSKRILSKINFTVTCLSDLGLL